VGQDFDLSKEGLLPRPFDNIDKRESLTNWFNRRIEPKKDNIFVETVIQNNVEFVKVYYHLHVRIHNKPKSYANRYERVRSIDVDHVEKNIEKAMESLNNSGKMIRVDFTGQFTMYDCDQESFGCFIKQGQRLPLHVEVEPIIVDVYHPFHRVWDDHNMHLSSDCSGRSFAYIADNVTKFNGEASYSVLLHELNHLLFGHRDAYFESEDAFKNDGRGLPCVEDEENLSSLNANNHNQAISPLEIYLGLRGRGYGVPGWRDYMSYLYEIVAAPKNNSDSAQ